MNDIASNVALGLKVALQFDNLYYCFLGVLLGTFKGVLPGIGALAAIALLFPLTFHLESTPAIIMLAGIWYGTAYGGSIASILINVPGSPSSAVTCLDGYPMAQQGRAGVALFATTIASFVGGSIGIILMMLFSPWIAENAVAFRSAEFFSLIVMSLVATSTIAGDSAIKSLAMVVFGALLGTVGTDMYNGVPRYNFDTLELRDGISLVAIAMGLFGVPEIICSVKSVYQEARARHKIRLRSMVPTLDDVRRSIMPTLRGSAIGSLFGVLPGTGPTIASFMAYAAEKRVSKRPEKFGHGAIEGITSPEAANNAADQTAFIPTMTLGIPGSAPMAIMMGALLIQGTTPGPTLITDKPELFWGLVMSFWVGNFFLLILNIPLVGLWVRILQIPFRHLYPAILVFLCAGVYSVGVTTFEIWTVILFGCLGYLMRLTGLPAVSLLLGFVLCPLLEEHFRRALVLSQGSLMTFIERPVSGALLAITAVLFASRVVAWAMQRRRESRMKATAS